MQPVSETDSQDSSQRMRKTANIKQSWKQIAGNWELYVLILPTVLAYVIFIYWPMYGVQIAFKDFDPVKGIWGSPWVGFAHFAHFFHQYNFWQIIANTFEISLYSIAVGFPIPVIVALMLNQLMHERFKKFIQTVIYAPHFISVVVLVGMVMIFLNPKTGLINHMIELFGGRPIFFMQSNAWFKTIFVFSGIWQQTGFSTIIYLAALSGVNPQLHEAAIMDGANKLQRIRHVDLPSILPTVVILFILQMGSVLNVDFQKIYLMQNSLNIDSSEVIGTYLYKMGLLQAHYSLATAIGLFNSVINIMLIVSANTFFKKKLKSSLW